jgi:hypothetical protein
MHGPRTSSRSSSKKHRCDAVGRVGHGPREQLHSDERGKLGQARRHFACDRRRIRIPAYRLSKSHRSPIRAEGLGASRNLKSAAWPDILVPPRHPAGGRSRRGGSQHAVHREKPCVLRGVDSERGGVCHALNLAVGSPTDLQVLLHSALRFVTLSGGRRLEGRIREPKPAAPRGLLKKREPAGARGVVGARGPRCRFGERRDHCGGGSPLARRRRGACRAEDVSFEL